MNHLPVGRSKTADPEDDKSRESPRIMTAAERLRHPQSWSASINLRAASTADVHLFFLPSRPLLTTRLPHRNGYLSPTGIFSCGNLYRFLNDESGHNKSLRMKMVFTIITLNYLYILADLSHPSAARIVWFTRIAHRAQSSTFHRMQSWCLLRSAFSISSTISFLLEI